MSTQEHPNILCTKCATVVPWQPHCPHCFAYLEFAGVPPWAPEPPVDPQVPGQLENDAEAEAGSADDMMPAADEPVAEEVLEIEVSAPAPVTVLPVATISMMPVIVEDFDSGTPGIAEDVTPEPGALALLWRGMRRDTDRFVTGMLAGLTLAIVLILLFGRISGTTGAALASPLLIGWALVSIAIFGIIPDQREFEIAAAEEARRLAAEEAERARLEREAELRRLAEAALVAEAQAADPDFDGDDRIRARAPQTVNATIERTAPLKVTVKEQIDLVCEHCGRLNPSSHRYCEQCGEVLAGLQVAPTVVAMSQQDKEKVAEEDRKRQGRVSSSWRTPIFAFAIGGVVIAALAFAFFGPGAFQLRFGLTRAFQVVNQWIDPYSGKAVTIETVTATSSLPGIEAQALATADARTFWASAPSTTFGAGTVLTYTLAQATEIDRMVIFPGIQSEQFDSRALATPKDITLAFDDGSKMTTTLASVDLAADSRQLVQFPQNVTKTITLTIDTVYPPRGAVTFDVGEVAISGTQFLEVPQAPKVFGFQNGTRTPGIPGVGSSTTQN